MILQTNPKANYLAYKTEIDQAIADVLDSGWYILGQQVKQLEAEFAAYLGVADSVGVANGTDALDLALRACGVGPGDMVLTVSHTAVATVAAIELIGAMPILVDIDPTSYTIDPNKTESTIKRLRQTNRKIKAVIPVHLYGHPADMPALVEICQRYGLYLIEDCAQAHGAKLAGKPVGTWGDIAAFSCYPTKNLGAVGDAGLVATNNPQLAEQVRLLQQYGWKQKYISDIAGLNSRLDEIQAAILRVKLRHLNRDNAQRQAIAKQYDTMLKKCQNFILTAQLPQVANQVEHVYHQYVIRTPHRDALQNYLREHGVGTLIHYPMPVHQQPAYADRVMLGVGGLPHTEQIRSEILSLPMHAQLSDNDVATVIEVVHGWDKNYRSLI
jgi:dTDP-4-amino-4,6-dideoxygalactose transaminase